LTCAVPGYEEWDTTRERACGTKALLSMKGQCSIKYYIPKQPYRNYIRIRALFFFCVFAVFQSERDFCNVQNGGNAFGICSFLKFAFTFKRFPPFFKLFFLDISRRMKTCAKEFDMR